MKGPFSPPGPLGPFGPPGPVPGRLSAPDVVKATFATFKVAKVAFTTRRYHACPPDPALRPLLALSYPQPLKLSTDRLWVTLLSDTPDTLGAGPSPGKGGGLGR
ncbi:hypothetical protein GCM10027598_05860 [Amycolatopsis oliviviridis]|uniref:Uncharacterized protein n=1 Tax=Amycolatopsis oliviviridis TaxID=1471590 RepID=A0ABQ3LSP3_9PSEU|nr:hypothetical protein GCM10017790_39260 [Amycolatopsis oliviviridis]